MKPKIILLLCFFCVKFSKTSLCQGYIPFPITDAVWYEKDGYLNYPLTNVIYEIVGDSIINNIEHKVINERYENIINTTFFLREDSTKRIYIRVDTIETLLYNFNISNIGDTIYKSYYGLYPSHTSLFLDTSYLCGYKYGIVTNIDSILMLNGSYRKIYFFNGNGFYWGQYIIEGIGSDGGLLDPISDPWESWHKLNCFKQDGALLMNRLYDGDKCEIVDIVENNSNNFELKVYYSQFDNELIINSENSSIKYCHIHDTKGALVSKININKSNNKYSLKLRAGLYVVRLVSDSDIQSRKLIIPE